MFKVISTRRFPSGRRPAPGPLKRGFRGGCRCLASLWISVYFIAYVLYCKGMSFYEIIRWTYIDAYRSCSWIAWLAPRRLHYNTVWFIHIDYKLKSVFMACVLASWSLVIFPAFLLAILRLLRCRIPRMETFFDLWVYSLFCLFIEYHYLQIVFNKK